MASPPNSNDPPTLDEISHLIRLLDDESPTVRQHISQRLALCGGDLSDFLSTWPTPLSAQEQAILSSLLAPARRKNLLNEWITPIHSSDPFHDDWQAFEASLCLISDFLHDGISLRLSLSDAIDLLAEDAEAAEVSSPQDLAEFLFEKNTLSGNHQDALNPNHADLAWVIDSGHSTALPLTLIFILTGHRLDFEIEAISYPQHYFARFYEDHCALLVDCFHQGALLDQETLLENPHLSHSEKLAIRHALSPHTLLSLLLASLLHALDYHHREQDAHLIRKIRQSLIQ